MFTLLLVAALAGPLLRRGDPNAYVGLAAPAPSAEHWFGTTTSARTCSPSSCTACGSPSWSALVGGGIAAVIGMVVGFTAGYRGGLVDEMLNALTNVVLVLPALAVLLVINAYLGVRSVARAGAVHRAHLLAVGGAGHPGADVLAARPGLHRPGPAQRRAHLEDHRAGDRART